jgi:hypothetical protein
VPNLYHLLDITLLLCLQTLCMMSRLSLGVPALLAYRSIDIQYWRLWLSLWVAHALSQSLSSKEEGCCGYKDRAFGRCSASMLTGSAASLCMCSLLKGMTIALGMTDAHRNVVQLRLS